MKVEEPDRDNFEGAVSPSTGQLVSVPHCDTEVFQASEISSGSPIWSGMLDEKRRCGALIIAPASCSAARIAALWRLRKIASRRDIVRFRLSKAVCYTALQDLADSG